MNIIFIGNVQLSALALKKLIQIGLTPTGVITNTISHKNADFEDLIKISTLHKIPTLDTCKINEKRTVDWIKRQKPNVIFCVGWSQIISSEILSIPSLGVIGFHPSALPANRGRHPIIWALVLGLTQTASTFFFLDEDVDSGRIISQEIVAIFPEDDAADLYGRISKTALKQLEQITIQLKSGTLKSEVQDISLANSWRARKKADGIIDWRMSAVSIHNLVRGLAHPYVGAEFLLNGETIKVWKTKLVPDVPMNREPGFIFSAEKEGPIIVTGSGGLLLQKMSPSPNLSVGSYL